VISAETVAPRVWLANNRLVFDWEVYAGRLAEQTVDQHLAAIWFMDEVLTGILQSAHNLESKSRTLSPEGGDGDNGARPEVTLHSVTPGLADHGLPAMADQTRWV